MTLPVHDFTRPLPLAPAVRSRLSQWLVRANTLAAERLGSMLVPIQLQMEGCSTAIPAETLTEWSDKTLAFRVVLEGQTAPSLIAIPNPLAQDIIGRMLGDEPTTELVERELSPAEVSIGQFAAETIVSCLNESWQEETRISLKVEDVEPNPRRTREFRPTDAFVDCHSSATTSLTTSRWDWFLSMDLLSLLFGLPLPTEQLPAPGESRKHLESLMRTMRTELSIRLGDVQLSGPQLSALRVGDLVVLNQRVSEPLQGSVRGEPKFLGWAGRIGDRQAFEIEAEIAPRHIPNSHGELSKPATAAVTVKKS